MSTGRCALWTGKTGRSSGPQPDARISLCLSPTTIRSPLAASSPSDIHSVHRARTIRYRRPRGSGGGTIEANLIGGLSFEFFELRRLVSSRDANLAFARRSEIAILTQVPRSLMRIRWMRRHDGPMLSMMLEVWFRTEYVGNERISATIVGWW